MEDKKQDAGALWVKESKAGNKFMSGVVEIDGVKTEIVVFKNNFKKADNHPDYRIYLSEKREKKPYVQPGSPADDHANGKFEDDIPFGNDLF